MISDVKSPLKLLTVLYLEDDHVTQAIVTDTLRPLVKELIIGEDGQFGLGLFKKYQPDLVITDLHMPKMSGIEMVQAIRELNPLVPIVITSGMIDTETLLSSIELKIDKYIVKPFTAAEIVAILEMLSRKVLCQTLVEHHMLLIDLSDEQKNFIIGNLRNTLSNLIKQHTGKGAKRTTVVLNNQQIEITLHESFNQLELNLSSSIYDPSILEAMRKAYYLHIRSDLESLVSMQTGLTVQLTDIQIDLKRKTEYFQFTPSPNPNCLNRL